MVAPFVQRSEQVLRYGTGFDAVPFAGVVAGFFGVDCGAVPGVVAAGGFGFLFTGFLAEG